MIRNPTLIKDMFDACSMGVSGIQTIGDLSAQNNLSQAMAKSLLLSCASYYELEITELIRTSLRTHMKSKCMLAWLEPSSVEGQFFKWFDFRNAKNTNRFLAMFGAVFRDSARKMIAAREYRTIAEADFMEICIKRNECVHKNYAAYGLDLTVSEIWGKHLNAMAFIRTVEYSLANYLS